jgi:protein-disulfide isomerase-like protein with CxxC motif
VNAVTQQVKVNINSINVFLLVLLLVIALFSLYALFGVQKQIGEIKAPEPPKLAALTVTVVTPPNCDDCFDSTVFAAAIKQLPLVNVTEEFAAFDSIEGQKLIKEHGLARLPAAVVTGETENLTIPSFTQSGDAFIFTETPPPYYDLSTGGVVGRVTITYLTDAACPKCFEIEQFGGQLEQVGVTVSSTKEVDINDKEGRELIERYSITRVPTMLLNDDALAYDLITQAWSQVGSEEADGMLVLRNVTPPYRDMATRQVRGLVTITYLSDNTCAECYNASLHKLVLQQSFAMQFKDEKSYDVNGGQGKTLASKYNIKKVPTVLLDREAEAYAALDQAWSQIGTQETDGTFVFRSVELLEGVTYKDLGENKILNSTG